MKLARTLFSVLLFAILFSGSCSTWSPAEGVYHDPTHANELKKVSESTGATGMNLSISSDIWIDRMPKIGNEPAELHGLITLRTADGMEMLESTSVRQIFVINGDEIWVASAERKPNDLLDTRIVNINSGPDWSEDTLVDVVCKFEVEGKPQMVQQKGVKIRAVY